MTGNNCLLDTSIIIHAFKSTNNVSERLDAIAEIYVPLTAIGELYYGAFKSSNTTKHITRLQSFLANCKILLPDIQTAEIYGNIKTALMNKGKPIPENDIWIAAISFQYNLPLFTSDEHFKAIESIRLFQ